MSSETKTVEPVVACRRRGVLRAWTAAVAGVMLCFTLLFVGVLSSPAYALQCVDSGGMVFTLPDGTICPAGMSVVTAPTAAPPTTAVPVAAKPKDSRSVLGKIGDFLNPVDDIVKSLVEKISEIFLKMMEALLGLIAEAAASILGLIIAIINGTTGVKFGPESWFGGSGTSDILVTIGGVAGLCFVVFFLLAIVQGIIHNDMGFVIKTVVREAPITMLYFLGGFTLLSILMQIVDQVSSSLLSGAAQRMGALTALFGLIAAGTGGVGMFLLMIGLLVFILAGIVVYIQLLIRSALLALLAAVSPLFIAARVWPTTRGSFKRLAEVVMSLVLSKLVMALAFSLGTAAMTDSTNAAGSLDIGNAINGVMVGMVLMVLAAFAPWMLMRIIPGVEGAMMAHQVGAQATSRASHGMQSAAKQLSGGSGGGTAASGLAGGHSGSGDGSSGGSGSSAARGSKGGFGAAAAAAAAGAPIAAAMTIGSAVKQSVSSAVSGAAKSPSSGPSGSESTGGSGGNSAMGSTNSGGSGTTKKASSGGGLA
jgi:type IV secretion system protein TrbL